MKLKFEVTGLDMLQKSFIKLGNVPQKEVTYAANRGMAIVRKAARSLAPVDTGELKKGVITSGEKSRTKGKKVIRIVFDPAKNDVFQKKSKSGKVTGYYPYSQEYGFFARDGRYIPGYHFVHKALQSNTAAMTRKIVDTMQKRIDRAILQERLK